MVNYNLGDRVVYPDFGTMIAFDENITALSKYNKCPAVDVFRTLGRRNIIKLKPPIPWSQTREFPLL